eukprot:Skav213535  [mRNA]  locus=scaffold1184:115283:117904:- [translate_table: standard]
MGEALQNEKLAGEQPGTDLPDAASSAMKDVSTMIRSGQQAVSKMFQQQQSNSGSNFNPVEAFADAFQKQQQQLRGTPAPVATGIAEPPNAAGWPLGQ